MKVVKMYEAGDRCPVCNNAVLKRKNINHCGQLAICKNALTLIFCPHCGYEIIITGDEIEEEINETY